MARDGRAEQRAGCSANIGLGLYMRAYTAVTAQSCYLINFAPRSWRGAHASISFRFFEQLTERDEGHLICTKHSIQPLQSAAEFRQHNSNAPGPLVSCTPKRARFLRHVGRCMSNCQRVEGGFLSSKPRGPTRGLEGSPFVPSRPRNVSAMARWIIPAPCQVVQVSQRPLRGPNQDSTERSLPLAVRVEQNLPARLF
jgi:hypothetical protein